jgi:UDP-GlcNAc:undecaprenyl-phosphate GlcNAc-1-phosphate transferase
MQQLEKINLLGFLLPVLVSTGMFYYYLQPGNKISKRFGGVIVGVTVIFFVTLFQSFYPGFLLPKDFWSLIFGIIILLVGGIWDDQEKISWQKQLLFQSAAALLVVFVGDTISHIRLPGGVVFYFPPFFSAILAYFWIILVIEALNWLDGVDGLSGSIGFITLLTLAILGLNPIVNQPSTTLLCLIVAGAVVGFLFFNFPPGKIHLGSAGIWILGFLIAVISIYSGGKVATTALVLGIPIIDFLFVSIERLVAGKLPVSGGDRRHLHERLIDLGWSPIKITAVISLFSMLLGIGALLTQTAGKFYLVLPLTVFFLFFAIVYKPEKHSPKK